MKKLAVLFLLGGGGWLIWRALTSIDEEYYSDNVGIIEPVTGFLKTAAGIASGDFGMEENNAEMHFSTAYMGLVKQMENGIRKGWDSSKQKWFVHLDSQNIPTIAYGHLVKPGESFSNGLTEAEAVGLLIQDIDSHAEYVRKNINPKLNQSQFDAVVDFVFNAGPGSLLGTGKFSRNNGLNPARKFNDVGIVAGLAEMARHYDILAARPAYKNSSRGLLNRKAMQQNMAYSAIYRIV